MYVRDIHIVIMTLAILLNFLYILIKLISTSTYRMLTIDNIPTYCHNSKLPLISITLLQKHIRSDIYEIDPFLYSDTRMC